MLGDGDNLKEKLTYFDMMGYFAPGFVLLWSLQQSARFVGVSSYFQMGNWALESFAGIIFAYVVGQVLSARGRARFESKSTGKWTAVFKDGLISENYLLKDRIVYGSALCAEERRKQLVAMAMRDCGLSPAEADLLCGWKDHLKDAQKISHRIYRPLLTLVTDEKIGDKAQTANVLYIFFRNLNISSAYSALIFVIAGAYNLGKDAPLTDARVVLSGILVLSFALTSFVARRQAIGAGINHVREVFDSAYHFYSARSVGKY
jgi:hypothetical protein